MNRVLIIGACGQIGTDLTIRLRKKLGNENVIASDIRQSDNPELNSGPFETLDIMDKENLERICGKYEISHVYLLAALLSATAEKKPEFAWQLNMEGLFNVLNLAKDKKITRVFWPSSIAVFGPGTPRTNTPQDTIMDPSTVYGISKLAGERWCAYYHKVFDVDVRSIRYPGLISYKTPPGGGTTDYAVEIFHEANRSGQYTCFLDKETRLPMMYMDDAVQATIQLMEADGSDLTVRSSYNISGLDFTPEELSDAIKTFKPDFKISYDPDFRQDIASSWPSSIDDSTAQKDWGWRAETSLSQMVEVMLKNC